MSSSTIYNRSRQSGFKPSRRGFTLTELLIGITIIGLLVGMLVVAGGGVLGTSREFAVNTEIVQLEQAIESFKTKYGFYPPSFEQFKRTVNTGDVSNVANLGAEAAQILPYLNKIAPNHRELEDSPTGNGRNRLQDWWEHVGCNLDQTSSLQFWLSGLCENKQYPLTGGLTTTSGSEVRSYMPVGYGVEVHVDGTEIPGGLSRQSFYEFDVDRFVVVDIDDSGNLTRPVVQYNMKYGKTNGLLLFVYRDSDSYLPIAQPAASGSLEPNDRMETTNAAIPAPSPSNTSAYQAYIASAFHRGLAYHHLTGTSTAAPLAPTFANPDTFQIITFGLDGEPGTQNETSRTITVNRSGSLGGPYDLQPGATQENQDRGNILLALPSSNDNLSNFAGGRLDKYKVDKSLE